MKSTFEFCSVETWPCVAVGKLGINHFLLLNLYYSKLQVFIGTSHLALCEELLLYYGVLWCVAG